MASQSLADTKYEFGPEKYGALVDELEKQVNQVLESGILPFTLIQALAHEFGMVTGEEPAAEALLNSAARLFPRNTPFSEMKLLLIRLVIEGSTPQRE